MGDGRPPMGLAYISAYLEKFGHETKIVDLYHFGGDHESERQSQKVTATICHIIDYDKPIDIFKEIEEYSPDFIGMYIGTVSWYRGTSLIKEIKRRYPNIPTMAGGPHANELPETLVDCFDYVVSGEGEMASLDIVEGRVTKKGVIRRPNIDDINKLPFPDFRHFIDKPYNWELEMFDNNIKPVLTLNSTRGCPFSCMFCGVANTKFRGISASNLIGHISTLVDTHGAQGIYFREDNFTVQPNRVEEFCDILISENMNISWSCETRVNNLSSRLIEKMARSGCVGLYIGVESGSERMLSYIRKGEKRKDFIEKFPIIHANGITTYTTWIYGMPSETEEDRKLNDEFIEKLNPTTADTFVYLGIPGSDFYKILDHSQLYEFKEESGVLYPPGHLTLARSVYGSSDPRVEYIESLYEKHGVKAGKAEPYYIPNQVYNKLKTTKIRNQLSERA
jgi:radical SAM superfamily enzyme YgiQ (UPF0313 family)